MSLHGGDPLAQKHERQLQNWMGEYRQITNLPVSPTEAQTGCHEGPCGGELWKEGRVAASLLLSSWAREDKRQVLSSVDVTCHVGTRGHLTQVRRLLDG